MWDYEIFWKEALSQIRGELEEQEFTMCSILNTKIRVNRK